MLNIDIKTIDHKKQRYETVGDWWWEGDKLVMRISDMKNWKYEFLVAVHEFIEAFLCRHSGIDGRDVDKFDIQFEKDRKKFKWGNELEPGNDPKAPYYFQHNIATGVERILATILGVNWDEYDKTVMNL